MKKLLYSLLAPLCLMSMAPKAEGAYGLFGFGGSYAIINANGGGNIYYHMTNGANDAFDGAILGTFNPGIGNSLVLNGGELQTYENGGDSVTSPTSLFYRIYSGAPSGSFTGIALNNLTFPGAPGDEKRDATTANVNVLTGLANGNYTLEVYSSAAVDWNGQIGGPAEDTIFASNSGNNYKASFSVIPEPSRLMLLGFGLVGLIFRRRR